ncbi:MAG: hypothetical protein LBC71_01475 [Oscillospiraceae bacterium]|jgi:ABC-type glycerol-3-phosphate transport system substrate-binding protein|nr:hypothetical protein [Oscillospiraceae bacterium]
MKKKLIAVVLVFVISLTITYGCKKDIDNNGNTDNGKPDINGIGDYVYVAETLPIPDDIKNIQNLIYIDNKLYFVSTFESTTYFPIGDVSDEVVMDDFYNPKYSEIFAMNLDGTDVNQLPDYTSPIDVAPGNTSFHIIVDMIIDTSNNLWVLEFWEHWEQTPEAVSDYSSGYALRKLDLTGAELLTVDINNVISKQEEFTETDNPIFNQVQSIITSINVDTDGNIYVLTALTDEYGFSTFGEIVYVLNNNGDIIYSESLIIVLSGQLNRLSDGRVACITHYPNDDGISMLALREISVPEDEDNETERDTTIVGGMIIEGFNQDAFSSSGDFEAFISNDFSLFGIETESYEVVKLLDWLDINIDVNNGGVESIIKLPDERIICNVRLPMSTRLYVLTKTPKSEIPEKITLTLAAYGMNNQAELRSMVAKFNSENDTYFIEVVDYMDYNIGPDDFAGLIRLNTEIVSGKIPDIISLVGMPYNTFAGIGLLEDLYPFIDNDPVYNRSDFMEGVFRAAEIDGKLYQVFPTFSISTILGSPSVLGSGMGWNLDDLRAVLDANPSAIMPFGFGYFTTKTQFLRSMIQHNIDEFINWRNGTANFDTDSFIEMLKFVNNNFPLEYEDIDLKALGIEPWETHPSYLVPRGFQIIEVMWFSDFGNYQYRKEFFGEELVFKGFPNDKRSGGSSISFSKGLAITTASEHKDVAWLLLRDLLDEDFQIKYQSNHTSHSFSTNKTRFNNVAAEWMDENSSVLNNPFTGEPLYAPLTQADVDLLLELINTLHSTINNSPLDWAFWDIISESAVDYFNGIRSAEDVARIIQSRMVIYVSERS